MEWQSSLLEELGKQGHRVKLSFLCGGKLIKIIFVCGWELKQSPRENWLSSLLSVLGRVVHKATDLRGEDERLQSGGELRHGGVLREKKTHTSPLLILLPFVTCSLLTIGQF